MAITYVIEAEKRLIALTATGLVSIQDVRDIQATLRCDPAFQGEYRQLFDFRAATPADIMGNDVRSLIETTPFSATSRRAYVAAAGVGYGMARIAEAVAQGRQIPLRVFLDIDEARQWLLADAH